MSLDLNNIFFQMIFKKIKNILTLSGKQAKTYLGFNFNTNVFLEELIYL
jgi:hypothetical protein